MNLQEEMANTIAHGLLRKSVKTCSKWSERYRVIKGEAWSFGLRPWTRQMHDTHGEFNVGIKAAQMGFTETMMNKTFYAMDIKNISVLYALPNLKPDASDFSASRFDPALESSEHLRSIFSNVKNVAHKRAGSANLWIRGSKSRVGFKSIDPGLVVLDEVDEMDQENIQLAFHRTDGQEVSEIWAISTPTIPTKKIDGMYLTTNQMRFFFQCPNCWKEITLEFPECLVVIGEHVNDPRLKESHVICGLCKKKIEHKDKIRSQVETGRWIAQYPEIIGRNGFYISQLNSCVKTPDRIAVTAIEAKYKPAAEQELWNSIGGKAHVVAGAQLNDSHIEKCQTTKRRMDDPIPPGYKIITMGVDVGAKHLHYVVEGWKIPKFGLDINFTADCEMFKCGTVENFSDIVQVAREFRILYLVVDKGPETRAAYDLCCQFLGRASRCQYVRSVGAKRLTVSNDKDDEYTVNANRTFWLDTSLGRIRTGRIILPIDTPDDYTNQLTSLVKIYKRAGEDSDEEDKSVYVNCGADHYGHARNYSEIALPLAASFTTSQDIKSFL